MKVWERRGGRGRWIVKPPALARGVGISVVNKFSKIPKVVDLSGQDPSPDQVAFFQQEGIYQDFKIRVFF